MILIEIVINCKLLNDNVTIKVTIDGKNNNSMIDVMFYVKFFNIKGLIIIFSYFMIVF